MQQEPKQVFISHSTHDIKRAREVCEFLEQNRVTCWIAIRDILGGTDYVKQVTEAIDECDVIVMLLSKRAQKSHYIQSELEWAVAAKKKIIPFMLEDFALNNEFAFHLPNNQWIDAYTNRAKADEILLASVENIIKEHGKIIEPQPTDEQPESIQTVYPQQKSEIEFREDPRESYHVGYELKPDAIVRIKEKFDKIRCPRCRSSFFVASNDDVESIRSDLLIGLVGTISVAIILILICSWLIDGLLIDRSNVTSAEYIEWIARVTKLIPFEIFPDFKGDVISLLGLVAAILLMFMAVTVGYTKYSWDKLAKSYRKRVAHTHSGMEAIPYKCKKCNEVFTVIVPLKEKWWN